LTLPALVDLQGVSREYVTRTGRVLAVDDMSMQVREREFVAILGPSGCGKSTLLKTIAGLLPPSRGKVLVDGQSVTRPLDRLGMVFQSPVLLRWRTVIGNVLFPADALGQRGEAIRERALGLLKLVGLEGFEQRYPHELSGGMAQRVSLARALLLDPRLLLMDEPFGALDALTRDEMGFELLRIWQERPKTVLFVTHSISESVLLADRVLVMTARPGRLALDVTIDLPRPRNARMRTLPRFGEIVASLQEASVSATEPSWRSGKTSRACVECTTSQAAPSSRARSTRTHMPFTRCSEAAATTCRC
jgi:NitT/TauT family transport system ATP-binding protein